MMSVLIVQRRDEHARIDDCYSHSALSSSRNPGGKTPMECTEIPFDRVLLEFEYELARTDRRDLQLISGFDTCFPQGLHGDRRLILRREACVSVPTTPRTFLYFTHRL